MTPAPQLFGLLSREHRDHLEELTREVSFAEDFRIFSEHQPAGKFWVIHSGTVALDLGVPGSRRTTLETLGTGDLLGWSWMFPPKIWHFGAVAFSPVRAYEFGAMEVLAACEEDPVFGLACTRAIAQILAHRLDVARTKLLEEYEHHGAPDFGI
ncbi:cyclic nucleotide-binding domain-containing protein [Streptomyces sp. GZWMJZ-114]|uniref:cyclic nucleotide-binding domain-containing protein n=1 Tax=Streptomyces sp. GZWMJZ-114 TaxID=2494734 RepID=UPI001010839D|nr:cyclic nucleotide-binding domain-containing protein [Streptomyces sp. GZWMJZ-114]